MWELSTRATIQGDPNTTCLKMGKRDPSFGIRKSLSNIKIGCFALKFSAHCERVLVRRVWESSTSILADGQDWLGRLMEKSIP